jgi:hypothetical protein
MLVRHAGIRVIPLIWWCMVLIGLTWEARALFYPIALVRAQGVDTFLLDDFGAGAPIGQTFRMLSDGLSAVDLQFSSRTPVSFPVRCRLLIWNAYATSGEKWVALYEWIEQVDLPAGLGRHRFAFSPVVPSDRTVYQFQIQRVLTRRDPPGTSIALVGSRDDVLKDGNIIDGREQVVDRDLVFQAYATGDTRFGEFRRRVNDQLPWLLRPAGVQLAVLAIYNWAVVMFAYRLTWGAGWTRHFAY